MNLKALAQKAAKAQRQALSEHNRTVLTLEKARVQAWVKPTAPIRQEMRMLMLELRLRRLDLMASLWRKLERKLMEKHRQRTRSIKR